MTLKKSSRSGNDINNYFFFKKNKNKSIYRIKKSIYPDNISHLPIFLSCSRIIQTREKKTEKEIQFHPWISTVISIRENNIEKRIIVRLVKQELYTIVRIGSKRFERNQVDLIADKEEQKGRKKIMENSWIREIDESSLDSRRAPLLFLFFFFPFSYEIIIILYIDWNCADGSHLCESQSLVESETIKIEKVNGGGSKARSWSEKRLRGGWSRVFTSARL